MHGETGPFVPRHVAVAHNSVNSKSRQHRRTVELHVHRHFPNHSHATLIRAQSTARGCGGRGTLAVKRVAAAPSHERTLSTLKQVMVAQNVLRQQHNPNHATLRIVQWIVLGLGQIGMLAMPRVVAEVSLKLSLSVSLKKGLEKIVDRKMVQQKLKHAIQMYALLIVKVPTIYIYTYITNK